MNDTIFKILHLTGSPTNDYHYNVSLQWARLSFNDCPGTDVSFSVVLPEDDDGNAFWVFPDNLEETSIKVCKKYPLVEALDIIKRRKYDAVIVTSYCERGLVELRERMEEMDLPLISGISSKDMKISTDKTLTNNILEENKISVPQGLVCTKHDLENVWDRLSHMSLPFIVKPSSTDNSVGVSLVRDKKLFDAALQEAFKYSDDVIIQKFIEGKEYRCAGCYDVNDKFIAFTTIAEYIFDGPIRTFEDKMDKTLKTIFPTTKLISLNGSDSDDSDKMLIKRLQKLTEDCGKALKLKDMILLDVRVDNNGVPYVLETCLSTCFKSRSSKYTQLAVESGFTEESLMKLMINKAISRKTITVK